MKTEINAYELAAIINENARLKDELRQMKHRAEALDPESQERNMAEAIKEGCNAFFCEVFKSLGFEDQRVWGSIELTDEARKKLSNKFSSFYANDFIVKLGVNTSRSAKQAFLKLGYDTEKITKGIVETPTS